MLGYPIFLTRRRSGRIWRYLLLTSLITIALFIWSCQLKLAALLYQTHHTVSPLTDVKPAFSKTLYQTHLTFSHKEELATALTKKKDHPNVQFHKGDSSEFTDKENSINHGPLPYDFHYNINEVNVCKDSIELLIFVISHSSKTDARKTLRETWASKSSIAKYNIKVLFLFGTLPNGTNDRILEEEHKQYHDVIQANFVDSYNNLTLKSMSMFNWVLTYCRNTKYLLKSDDDVYVNIDVLITILRTETAGRKFLLGRIQPSCQVIRKRKNLRKSYRKWILSRREYPKEYFPAYILGSAYSMSYLAIPDLYAASLNVNFIKLEDVFVTGLCAENVKMKRIMNPGWLNTSIPSKLRHHAVSQASLSPLTIRRLHTILQNK